MHSSFFEVLLISFSIASSTRAYELGDFSPYIKENYFDTQRDDGKLLSEFTVDLIDKRSLGSFFMNHLFGRQSQQDLQTFTSAYGGVKAPPIVQSNDPKRPYQVQSDTFPDYLSAASKTCDVQHNLCGDMVNSVNAQSEQQGQNQGQNGDAGTLQLPQATVAIPTSRVGQSTSSSQKPQSSGQQNSGAQQQGQNQGQDHSAGVDHSAGLDHSTTTSSAAVVMTSSTSTSSAIAAKTSGATTSSAAAAKISSTKASSSTSSKQSSGANAQQGQNSGNDTTNGNNKERRQNTLNMAMCESQYTSCNNVVRAAAVQTFSSTAAASSQTSKPFDPNNLQNLGPDPNDPSFDLLCNPPS